MEKNIMFSKLTKIEKEELYNFLLNYEIDYRFDLEMDDSSTFGMEIETVTKQKYEERKNPIAYLFADPEAYISPSYYEWWLIREFNLTESENEWGYEIVSPILKDTEKTWKEVLDILKGLQKMNFSSNALCSSHIHFGIDLMNQKSIVDLLKMWALYEDVLYRFSYGEFCNARIYITKFANPISKYIKDLLLMMPDDIKILDIINELPSGHASGLNLSNYRNIIMDLNNSIKTIEVRCPNGTLNPVIWQNNINTFGKLFEFIHQGDYDEDMLEYKLWNSENFSYTSSLNYSKINFEKALEFADLIFNKNIDKVNFLRQYIKDGKEKKGGHLQKTLSFTKKVLHY